MKNHASIQEYDHGLVEVLQSVMDKMIDNYHPVRDRYNDFYDFLERQYGLVKYDPYTGPRQGYMYRIVDHKKFMFLALSI